MSGAEIASYAPGSAAKQPVADLAGPAALHATSERPVAVVLALDDFAPVAVRAAVAELVAVAGQGAVDLSLVRVAARIDPLVVDFDSAAGFVDDFRFAAETAPAAGAVVGAPVAVLVPVAAGCLLESADDFQDVGLGAALCPAPVRD